MTDTLKPRDDQDVESAIRWALAEAKSIEIVGHGSKRAIGRPAQADVTLDLSGLAGVTLYEPEELVLSARAGTPISEIESLVRSKSQYLAFEPMDFGPLLGGIAGQGTIGGILAANVSGPRRIKAGAARDHFLGFRAISGRGETFKSGGRVVKNVTGYDLCKLMAGSWGTLAALTDVTIKTLPRPETEVTVAVLGLDDAAAVKAMTAAMASPCEVSAAAHLPPAVAARIPIGEAAGAGRALTVLRLEGVAPSVAHHTAVLTGIVKTFGDVGAIAAPVSQALWEAIRDATPFAASRSAHDEPLWRISTAPAQGATMVAEIGRSVDADCLYDWAGGLIWMLLRRPGDDGGAKVMRDAVRRHGGHATLIRAPMALRAAVAAFQPQDEGMLALTKRVKDGFDPKGVLNPGRMWTGV